MDTSHTDSRPPHNSADPADTAHDESIDDSDINVPPRLQSGDDATDVHSYVTVSEDISFFYGNFFEKQGLKQDLYSLRPSTDSVYSLQEDFRRRRH